MSKRMLRKCELEVLNDGLFRFADYYLILNHWFT